MEDKVVLIVGGSGGIGQAAADLLPKQERKLYWLRETKRRLKKRQKR